MAKSKSQARPGSDAASLQSQEALRLYEVQRQLFNLGVDDELEIPKLVVCGDQSAGKSSVMERICGVPLPRATGTCTRCPMELHVIKADAGVPWSCDVKLRFEDQAGSKPRLVHFGETILDKACVKDVVRRAQAAVLNPDKEPQGLLSGELPHENQLKFTADPVVLEIRDPDLTNLTLVDLPGIMRSLADADDQKYVDMVRELTKVHISKPEAIIVAAIACTTDIENQEIFQLAREVDPSGERTVGVLTKVDRIETGHHAKWTQYMLGKEYGLKLGYAMLRNPTQEELDANATRQETDQQEAQAFEQEPFKSFPEELKARLGLHKLVGNLSTLLLGRLRKSLPGLKANAKASLHEIETELATLPQLIPEAQIPDLLRKLLEELSNSIKQDINSLGTGGTAYGGRLGVDLGAAFTRFRQAVTDSKPMFSLFTREEEQVFARYGSDTLDNPRPDNDDPRLVSLEEVEDIITRHKGLELPGHLPYAATLAVIDKFQSTWYADMVECLDEVQSLLTCRLEMAAADAAKDWPRLCEVLQVCGAAVAEQAFLVCKDKLKEAVRAELSVHPYTVLDDVYLADFEFIRDGIKTQLAERASPTLHIMSQSAKQQMWIQALNAFPGLSGITNGLDVDQAIGRLLVLPPEQDWAVTIMATSMAYFEISSRRISEAVPQIIRSSLKEVLAAGFRTAMEQRLMEVFTGATGPAQGDASTLDTPDYLGGASCYSNPAVLALVLNDPQWRSNTNRRELLVERRSKLQSVLRTLHILS